MLGANNVQSRFAIVTGVNMVQKILHKCRILPLLRANSIRSLRRHLRVILKGAGAAPAVPTLRRVAERRLSGGYLAGLNFAYWPAADQVTRTAALGPKQTSMTVRFAALEITI